ncbi:hypothetical protein KR059_007874, partial [Drosophila kikkawai]
QAQDRGRDADNEIKSKLETLEVKIEKVQAKVDGQLQEVENKLAEQLHGVEAKLERQLQEVQTNLEGQQTKMEAKLEDSLLAVKTKLEGQQVVLTKMENSQAKLEENLLAVQIKLEAQLQVVLNQLQALSNKIDAAMVGVPQQVAPASATITFERSSFKRFGTRYFRIVNEEVLWNYAERRCREMGGYLASIRNEVEINAIIPKLEKNKYYWLGINDQENEGHFVSVASQKPAPFLKWAEGEPNDSNHKNNCLYLYNGKMGDGYCSGKAFFICQA